MVQVVTEGAPADQAGIQVNDIIVKVGDTEIRDSNTLVQAIASSKPGDMMTFHIYRQGQEIQLDVEIGSKTESALKNEENADEEILAQQGMPQGGQQGMQDWNSMPFEDFFNFFGY